MNSPRLAVEKLEMLARLAFDAESEIDRAAIYAAVTALTAGLDAESERAIAYVGENIERARWHICAMIGYDTTNGHANDLHLTWALGATSALQRAWQDEG